MRGWMLLMPQHDEQLGHERRKNLVPETFAWQARQTFLRASSGKTAADGGNVLNVRRC